MPAKRKHSPQMRQRAAEMYWHGRGTPAPGERPRGTYTLVEIERATGIRAGTVWAIARGIARID